MTRLSDVANLDDLKRAIEDKLIKVQTHPEFSSIAIYNYTDRALFQGDWAAVVCACRGLIVNRDSEFDGELLARPWSKFFNRGQVGAATIDWSRPFEASDKFDGSLGIGFIRPDDVWQVATRGSFTSDQSVHATVLLKDFKWIPNAKWTPLWEIIYPDNRIVVDYGDRDELVMLGAVNIATGAVLGPKQAATMLNWRGTVSAVIQHSDLEDFDSKFVERPGAEGIVIRQDNAMIKIKQSDYVRLHAIISAASTTTVWEALRTGQSVESLIAGLPDEFAKWLIEEADGQRSRFSTLCKEARDIFSSLSSTDDRKGFAELARKTSYPSLMFTLYDGKSIDDAVWKMIKPAWRPARFMSEDTA